MVPVFDHLYITVQHYRIRAKKRRNVDRVLVVVTDGRTTYGTETLIDPLTDLKMLKVTRFAVGVGDKVKENELNLIASDKEYVAMVDNFDGFNKALARLNKTICRPLSKT